MRRDDVDLVDRYLQAVKMWLPAREREDISAELGEDIRSEVDEMERERGRKLSAEELEGVLRRRGRPIVAAGRFRTQGSLIGPTFFPLYLLALRAAAIPFAMLWVVRCVYLFVTSASVRESPVPWLMDAGTAFWTSMIVLFGWVTLIFAVLERVQSRTRFLDAWNPRGLAPVRR